MNALGSVLYTHDVDFEYHEECFVFVRTLSEYLKSSASDAIVQNARVFMVGPSEMKPLVKNLNNSPHGELEKKKFTEFFDAIEDWRFEVPQHIVVSYQLLWDDKLYRLVRIYPVSSASQKKIEMLKRQKQSDHDKAEELKKKIEKQRMTLASYKDKLMMIENPRQADKEFFGHELEENTYTISLD